MPDTTTTIVGNLYDNPEVRYTEGGIARARFRVAVSGRREQQASFFTVIVWRDQAQHAAESLSKGSRVVVVGRLQQRAWTAEDGNARSVVEVVAEELGPSLRWATATATRRRGAGDRTGRPSRGRRGAAGHLPDPVGDIPHPKSDQDEQHADGDGHGRQPKGHHRGE
jgi:single-strand DNA-binding protein